MKNKRISLLIIALFLLANMLAYTSYALVPDSDADGVPNYSDKCPDSQTDVVDQFGCSCDQKTLSTCAATYAGAQCCNSDNNPCTDKCSVIKGLPACQINYNKNPCAGGYCLNGTCTPIGQVPLTISLSRIPIRPESNPYRTDDTTNALISITPWESAIGYDWLFMSETTDIVNDSTKPDADFVAAWADINAQGLCDNDGRCKINGTWKDPQFNCNGINVNNVRKRAEWIVINGVSSNHNIFYFRCSDQTICKIADGACNFNSDCCNGLICDAGRCTANLIKDAMFISQNVPAAMTPLQIANASITMRNTGTTNWSFLDDYKLGSQNPQDNIIWGIGRVDLNGGEIIEPTQDKTFTFLITAPNQTGTYNFQWRMLQEFVTWFGEYTSNIQIVVS